MSFSTLLKSIGRNLALAYNMFNSGMLRFHNVNKLSHVCMLNNSLNCYLIAHYDEMFNISEMQFYHIPILQDVVSFYHYAVVLARAPDAGVLHAFLWRGAGQLTLVVVNPLFEQIKHQSPPFGSLSCS